MHAMLHYIKVHACTMLACGHAIKVALQRMQCIHALRGAVWWGVYGAYTGTVHYTVSAYLVREYSWGDALPSCIYTCNTVASVRMLEYMVEFQMNRLPKLVYVYMEVGHGVGGYKT